VSKPDPVLAGPYQTWDDVVIRWIGQNVDELYDELGPPNFQPQDLGNGLVEMMWDFTVDRTPGLADRYGTLPLIRSGRCRLAFIADQGGKIVSGRQVGCT
jgi:hypothetical protein